MNGTDPQSVIQLLVVDDVSMVIAALKSVLRYVNDIKIVGEAETRAEAFAMAADLHPDVILLDVILDNTSSHADTIHQLLAISPGSQVVAISAYSDVNYADSALKAGAWAYASKADETTDILDAVRAAHRRLPWKSNAVQQYALDHIPRQDPDELTVSEILMQDVDIDIDTLASRSGIASSQLHVILQALRDTCDLPAGATLRDIARALLHSNKR
jgi:NarL family two-component system response regulator LiaR